jgi:hypothetical protein
MKKSRHARSNRQIPAPPQHAADDEEQRLFEPLNAEWVSFHDRRPPTLYHYTTAQGLLGIMESNKLWATNVRFLNDPSEIDYAICIIRESLGSAPLPANFRDQVNYRLDESEAEARVYVCCFCVEGDLLSQWRTRPPAAESGEGGPQNLGAAGRLATVGVPGARVASRLAGRTSHPATRGRHAATCSLLPMKA